MPAIIDQDLLHFGEPQNLAWYYPEDASFVLHLWGAKTDSIDHFACLKLISLEDLSFHNVFNQVVLFFLLGNLEDLGQIGERLGELNEGVFFFWVHHVFELGLHLTDAAEQTNEIRAKQLLVHCFTSNEFGDAFLE